MKISKQTLAVLNNFAAINPNCLIDKKTSTVNEQKSILATAHFGEDFPEFGIYNLSEFLSTIDLVESDPEIEFSEKHATLSNDNTKVKYYFASKNLLTYPEKSVNMPNTEVQFELSQEQIVKLKKASSTLFDKSRSNFIMFNNENEKLYASVVSSQNGQGNSFQIELGTCDIKQSFKIFFSIENFVFLSDDYDVSISSKLISEFKAKNYDLRYWVAVEQNSTFE
jgi:hypothetical protein